MLEKGGVKGKSRNKFIAYRRCHSLEQQSAAAAEEKEAETKIEEARPEEEKAGAPAADGASEEKEEDQETGDGLIAQAEAVLDDTDTALGIASTARAAARMVTDSDSRRRALSSFESRSPGISMPGGKTTAAATTGPARAPRPTSSTRATKSSSWPSKALKQALWKRPYKSLSNKYSSKENKEILVKKKSAKNIEQFEG